MTEERKDSLKFISSLFLLISGVIIVFISLYLPPQGAIDPSVLTLMGENFTFIGACWGFKEYSKVQIERINKHNERLLDDFKREFRK